MHPQRVRQRGLDRIGVRHGDDGAAAVARHQRGQRAGDACLHLGERLAVGKPKAARIALDLLPLGLAAHAGQAAAGPCADVQLEQPAVDPHRQAAGLGDGQGRLARALERRGIDGGHALELGDAASGGLGLAPSLVGQVQAEGAAGQNTSGRRRQPVTDEKDGRGRGTRGRRHV